MSEHLADDVLALKGELEALRCETKTEFTDTQCRLDDLARGLDKAMLTIENLVEKLELHELTSDSMLTQGGGEFE